MTWQWSVFFLLFYSLNSLTQPFEPFRFCLRIRGDIRNRWVGEPPTTRTLIKEKIILSSYIVKFRVEQLQSHIHYEEWLPNIWGNVQKFLNMRNPLVIYDFVTAPLWISLYMRKIWFSFFSVYSWKICPVAKFIVLGGGDKVNSCTGLSYWPAAGYIGWLAVTTILCRSQLSPLVMDYEFDYCPSSPPPLQTTIVWIKNGQIWWMVNNTLFSWTRSWSLIIVWNDHVASYSQLYWTVLWSLIDLGGSRILIQSILWTISWSLIMVWNDPVNYIGQYTVLFDWSRRITYLVTIHSLDKKLVFDHGLKWSCGFIQSIILDSTLIFDWSIGWSRILIQSILFDS